MFYAFNFVVLNLDLFQIVAEAYVCLIGCHIISQLTCFIPKYMVIASGFFCKAQFKIFSFQTDTT